MESKLGYLDLFTIVLVTLKLIGIGDYSWWIALAPTIISIAMFIILMILGFVLILFGKMK